MGTMRVGVTYSDNRYWIRPRAFGYRLAVKLWNAECTWVVMSRGRDTGRRIVSWISRRAVREWSLGLFCLQRREKDRV